MPNLDSLVLEIRPHDDVRARTSDSPSPFVTLHIGSTQLWMDDVDAQRIVYALSTALRRRNLQAVQS